MTWSGLTQRWRRWQLARRGVLVHRSCSLGAGVSVGLRPAVHPPEAIHIGPECQLLQGVVMDPWGGSIRLGRRVFVGPGCVIYGHGGVEIGDFTLIAAHCCIFSSEHAVPARSGMIFEQPDILLPTKIGRDVWLGAGVNVLGGVSIGDGCVVGAGAVVTKDLPPYSIAVGVPARVIRQRV